MTQRRQHFDLEPGESLLIGDTRITVQAKTGRRSRLLVESDLPTQKSRGVLPQPNATAPPSTLKRPGS